jgi:tungstate transport system substrate-binding protein
MVVGSTPKTMVGTALVVLLVASLMVASLLVAGCGQTTLTMVTTQASVDSGLLAKVLPGFEDKYDVKVEVVAKPSCADALKTAQAGNADVALVSNKTAEDEFVKNGYGLADVPVMYSDLVVLGPTSDPAAIRGLDCPGKSCKKIGTAGATFIARGDGSDIDKKVMMYWEKAGINPMGQPWYVKTGQGMAETLAVAGQKQGYIISDRLTYLANQNNLPLAKLVEGCTMLFNQYGMIVVNPAKFPSGKINAKSAGDLVWYLTGKDAQKQIGSFKKYNAVIFHPNAETQTNGLGSYKAT